MEPVKETFRNRARQLGFVRCGFTTPDPPAHFPDFEKWIAAGRHAGMDYLATGRSLSLRARPERCLPSARSILALAAPYPPPQAFQNRPLEARVAAYAGGDDYHEVLRERLRRLGRDLDALAGRPLRHSICVDTGPVLERELASRAGLGWIGRNSMLIHPAGGSYFFIALLFTEMEFAPDPPFAFDRCGTCRRCAQACPTGCILPDRTIDASRCISYLTIENRAAIPVELRSRVGPWAFGCDVCQMVCPWNRKSPAETESPFRARAHFPILDAARETALTEEEWQQRFRKSPLRRSRRDGYLRNLLVVLGNSRRKEALPFLIPLQADPNPILRECADWAIDKISG